jgi:hypothetical protein
VRLLPLDRRPSVGGAERASRAESARSGLFAIRGRDASRSTVDRLKRKRERGQHSTRRFLFVRGSRLPGSPSESAARTAERERGGRPLVRNRAESRGREDRASQSCDRGARSARPNRLLDQSCHVLGGLCVHYRASWRVLGLESPPMVRADSIAPCESSGSTLRGAAAAGAESEIEFVQADVAEIGDV